jgi:hypothetical protein
VNAGAMRWQSKIASCALVALLGLAGGLWAMPAAAQSYRIEKKTEAPPAGISPAVRATLSPNALVVTDSKGLLCEIWLRQPLPAIASPAQQLGVTFNQIAPGTLVGAVRFAADVTDYRDQTIHSGVYTLRYNLSPVDGNHQGVAPQRDFLLAIPAADDPDPATLTSDQTIALSRKSTTTSHPSVWSLGPVDSATSSLPAMEHHDEDNSWAADFQIQATADSPIRMSLVVSGQSPDI